MKVVLQYAENDLLVGPWALNLCSCQTEAKPKWKTGENDGKMRKSITKYAKNENHCFGFVDIMVLIYIIIVPAYSFELHSSTSFLRRSLRKPLQLILPLLGGNSISIKVS